MNSQSENKWTLPTTNIVYLDIETDGIQASEVHCVVTKRGNEGHSLHTCRQSLFEELARGGHVCGHNII